MSLKRCCVQCLTYIPNSQKNKKIKDLRYKLINSASYLRGTTACDLTRHVCVMPGHTVATIAFGFSIR